MGYCLIIDIKASGNYFTWKNKKGDARRVFCKLVRVLSNDALKDLLPTAEVSFMTEGEYDHSPTLLRVYPVSSGKKDL